MRHKTRCWPDSDVSAAGFSLLEIIGVLAIIAIVVTLGYPRLATLSSIYRLEGAARNLAADLQKTRFRAIAEGTRFQVAFDIGARTYQIQKETSPGSFANDGSAKPVDDANSITILATANPIFTPRGGAQSTSIVTLTARNGAVRLVAVESPGRVHVQ